MILNFEIALPLGAIGFYLYDSAMLLYGNELAFILDRGKWSGTGGLDVFVHGRRLGWPVIARPWALLFRITWRERDGREDLPVQWPPESFRNALLPVKWVCTALLVVLLLPLPIVSIACGAGMPLLIVFAIYYGLVFAALAVIYIRRCPLNLGYAAFWKLAIDALACPPFAVNLVSKLSLHHGMPGNPLTFAAAHFHAPEYDRLVRVVRSRIEDFILRETEGSAASEQLMLLRDQLEDRSV